MATASDARADELGAIVREIRDRVRSRYPEGEVAGLEIPLPDLMPILHARDAAEAKVAAIGSVNPRPPGLLNAIIQWREAADRQRLGWFVRDQVDFNRTTVNAIDATLEALNEVNRSLASRMSLIDMRSDSEGTAGRSGRVEGHPRALAAMARKLGKAHSSQRSALPAQRRRPECLLRAQAITADSNYPRAAPGPAQRVSDGSGPFDQRNTAATLGRLEQIRIEYERLIHYELRLIRQQRSAGSARSCRKHASAS